MPLKVQLTLSAIGLELYQLGVHTRAKKLKILFSIMSSESVAFPR